MSTENVSLFIQSIATNEELAKALATTEESAVGWSAVAANFGYEFSADDFHQFVCQVMDKPDLGAEDAMTSLLAAFNQNQELSEQDLDKVAGGGSRYAFLGFSSSLFKRMRTVGFPMLGGSGSTARTVIVKDSGASAADFAGSDFEARTVII